MIKSVRKIFVGIIGGTVLLIGMILIITPGPAIIIIPLGLTILATEFLWARKLLSALRDKISRSHKTSN